MSHIFAPKNDKDSVPYLTVLTLLLSRLLFLRKLYLQWEGTNTSFNIVGEYPCKTLEISIASAHIFLWCIVRELSLSSSS